MRLAFAAVLFALLLALMLTSTAGAQESGCGFVYGFKTLHDLMPATVGECLQNESHNNPKGDGLQQTTKGLMVWRKADNVAAFTDGYRTWVLGPFGLQERFNDTCFVWEEDVPLNCARVGARSADWKVYTRLDLGFTISTPPNWVVEVVGNNSINAYITGSQPSAGPGNFFYVSAVPAGYADEPGDIYNYNGPQFRQLMGLEVGESVNLSDTPGQEAWFSYTRLPDTTIGGQTARGFINRQPWEFPSGTTEERFVVDMPGRTYIIGGYYGSLDANEYYITTSTFRALMANFQFNPTAGQTSTTYPSLNRDYTVEVPVGWTRVDQTIGASAGEFGRKLEAWTLTNFDPANASAMPPRGVRVTFEDMEAAAPPLLTALLACPLGVSNCETNVEPEASAMRLRQTLSNGDVTLGYAVLKGNRVFRFSVLLEKSGVEAATPIIESMFASFKPS